MSVGNSEGREEGCDERRDGEYTDFSQSVGLTMGQLSIVREALGGKATVSGNVASERAIVLDRTADAYAGVRLDRTTGESRGERMSDR